MRALACSAASMAFLSYDLLLSRLLWQLPELRPLQDAPALDLPRVVNYSTFAASHSGGTRRAAANGSAASPLLSYFPDFCADCIWGGGRHQTCQARVDYLKGTYHTPDAEEVVMQERVVCRNPPLQILWQDDGVDELDNIFVQPPPSRENITTSPMLGKISIYVYDNLRKDVGDDLVEKMRRQYSRRNNTETNAQADIALVDLFRTFPGRTEDPTAADVFVVPYPHASHCVSKPTGVWLGACMHVAHGDILEGVVNALDHYVGNERRHLFLNVINQGNSNPAMRSTPLALTIGPRFKSANLIVPYLNNLPSFQPSAVRGRGRDWWTRPRAYAAAYFFGLSNSRMRDSPRVQRRWFMEEVQRNWPPDLGGLPYAIRAIARGQATPSRIFTHVYKDSVFCPCLPGDTPPQKRFFDVILMGCIPVVLAFDTSGGSGVSWHKPGGTPVEDAYPWIAGSNSTRDEIDYRAFVVEVTGGVGRVRPVLEDLLRDHAEIRRRQLALMEHAPYFSYGVGTDAHKHPDAFSRILESLVLSRGRSSAETR